MSESVPEQPASADVTDGATSMSGTHSRALASSSLRSPASVLPGGGDGEPGIAAEVQWVQRRETHWRAIVRADRLVPAAVLPAVAAGSFAAGAALARLVQRWRMHALSTGSARRAKLGSRGAGDGGSQSLRVVASRSLLVHVHVLGEPEK